MAHSAADWVTIARFPLAAGVAVTAVVGGPSSRVLVVVLAVLAALTDVADGWLARHLASATPRGAALDSVADGVLAVALLVALLELVPPGE